jgi:hypothetical protein
MKVGDKVRFSLKKRQALCRAARGNVLFAPHVLDKAIIVQDRTFCPDYEHLNLHAKERDGIWRLRWQDGKESDYYGNSLSVVDE